MCVLSDIVFIFAVSCVYLEMMCVFIFYLGQKLQILEHQGLSCESFQMQEKKKKPAFVKEFRSVLLLSFAKCFHA